jgi:hypothetical protein
MFEFHPENRGDPARSAWGIEVGFRQQRIVKTNLTVPLVENHFWQTLL